MRLIDADPIMQRLTHAWDGTPTVDNYRDGAPVLLEIREIKDLIRNAPTVNPWVKTAFRLPDDHEMLNGCVPIVDERGYGSVQKRQVLERYPRDYPWWLPLPALPEKEDGTPANARRDYPQKPTSGLIEEDA
jgi:hypothetical protein